MLTAPTPPPSAWTRCCLAALVVVSLLLTGLVAVATAPPAGADARVSVSNGQGAPVVDTRYATTLTVRGQGFQSIKNGHGGIYVFFGTTSGTWQPSRGGQTGRNLMYVPDSETKDNRGFQKFVAFPGSDTAAAANGGTLRSDGTWSTQIVVPGAVFKARDRSNRVQTVDCRKTRCGIITIGAHGVKNARNETFTPVRVEDLGTGRAAAGAGPSSDAAASPTEQPGASAAPGAKAARPGSARMATPTLTVDRATAVAGRVLSFSATGLAPGEQVVVTLDDGVAAVGPLSAGSAGQLAGVLRLPPDVGVGTHQLRLGTQESGATVSFPVSAPTAPTETDGAPSWLPVTAAGLALLLLLTVLVLTTLRVRAARRKGTRHAAALT